jgi:hypothetical protein
MLSYIKEGPLMDLKLWLASFPYQSNALHETSKDRENNFHSLMTLELERGDVEFEGYEQERLDSDNSDDENVETFELKALKSFCGDMMDEVCDESSFPLNSELDGYRRKDKSHAKSCLKKTCKFRSTKNQRSVANERNLLE